jgi:hypothetical protein
VLLDRHTEDGEAGGFRRRENPGFERAGVVEAHENLPRIAGEDFARGQDEPTAAEEVADADGARVFSENAHAT